MVLVLEDGSLWVTAGLAGSFTLAEDYQDPGGDGDPAMKRTRFWVGVLAAAALLSVGAILLLGRWSGGGHMARIYQDGVLIREIDLDSLSAPLTFTVEFQGRTNTITAQPGRIRVESADCPDQVCVDQGWISDGTVPVVCLPNRLVIQIEGGGDGLDSATG